MTDVDAVASRAGKTERTAVLLYGLLREYRTTAGSLLRHVVEPSRASIFYFGPKQTDRPTKAHVGTFDERGFFTHNPKGDFDPLMSVEAAELAQVYGSALVRSKFHQVSQEYFLKQAETLCAREDWLFMLSPHRLLSMFYNMAGAARMLREYEEETGCRFDRVVITRPDLAFYAPVSPDVRPGELHLADGEGFDNNGHARRGNAGAFFYKDASTGSYIPPGGTASFNDQVLVLRREDLHHFENIYGALVQALKAKVPASPETIFYLLLVNNAGLAPVVHGDWLHEIFRAGDPVVKGVTDTPAITSIDPRHPKARRFLSPDELRHLYPEEAEHRLDEAPAAVDDALHDGSVDLLSQLLLQGGRKPALPVLARLREWRLLRRARQASRRGALVEAESYYSRLLKLNPRLHRAWVQYAHTLKTHGDRQAALTAYGMALKVQPDHRDALLHYEALQRDQAVGAGR